MPGHLHVLPAAQAISKCSKLENAECKSRAVTRQLARTGQAFSPPSLQCEQRKQEGHHCQVACMVTAGARLVDSSAHSSRVSDEYETAAQHTPGGRRQQQGRLASVGVAREPVAA